MKTWLTWFSVDYILF